MADLLEVAMIVLFGLSWPVNISKAWKSRTAKGTSLLFYCFVLVGYICGIASKVLKLQEGIDTPLYVWFFYGLNALMVTGGILIFFRNMILDMMAARAKSEPAAQEAPQAQETADGDTAE